MDAIYLPGVVRAEYVQDYVLDITFNDGTQKRVDISQWFKGPVFDSLRKKAFFKKFFVEAATVAWPNGVDIAPESLYAAQEWQAREKRPTRRPQRKVAGR